jgi:rubredoxin-NAD+ reductase
MPVVVKTPLLPVTVVAPAAASEAQWHAVANAEGLEFHCLDEHARLVGFALSGAACGRRAALVQRVGQPLA